MGKQEDFLYQIRLPIEKQMNCVTRTEFFLNPVTLIPHSSSVLICFGYTALNSTEYLYVMMKHK